MCLADRQLQWNSLYLVPLRNRCKNRAFACVLHQSRRLLGPNSKVLTIFRHKMPDTYAHNVSPLAELVNPCGERTARSGPGCAAPRPGRAQPHRRPARSPSAVVQPEAVSADGQDVRMLRVERRQPLAQPAHERVNRLRCSMTSRRWCSQRLGTGASGVNQIYAVVQFPFLDLHFSAQKCKSLRVFQIRSWTTRRISLAR
jgi:hypothetical protein